MSDDIQSAAKLAQLIELSRGIHHGIALGDAADQLTSNPGTLQAGVATQLTLATTQAMIRTMERAGQHLEHDWAHENLTSLHQWATAQAIPGLPPHREAAPSLLTHLPGYTARHGSAPATVRALRHGPHALNAPGHQSLGAHALVRTLPFAVLVGLHGPEFTWPLAQLTAITHGHPLAAPTAITAALLTARAADRSTSLQEAWLDVLEHHLPPGADVIATRVGTAIMTAATDPHSPDQVTRLAPNRSAISTLAAAVYTVLSHPDPDQLPLAMGLASFSPDKTSTSAIAGALLGARWGSTPMLHHGASRLELAWASDALATDLAMTTMLTPLAKEPNGHPWLPAWGTRYAI